MSLRIACVRVPRSPTGAPEPAEAWERLAGALLPVAPRVTPVRGAGGLGAWADASGMERHGGDGQVARGLLEAARAAGFAGARVGVAGTCVAAALATRERGSAWRVVPPGRDAAFVARRPLSLLPMTPELRQALELLGLRRCDELGRLPAAEVELRFGVEGMAAWRLARGEDARWPFRPPPVEGVAAEAELEAPVATIEPLRFLLRGLISSVVAQLGRRQRIPAGVRLVLLLDGEGREELPVRPARPTADERVLGDLCWRALEGHAAGAGVVGVRLEGVEEGTARADQLDIFRPAAPDPAAVHAALLPLLARWGDGALSRALPRGAHLPGEQVVWEARGARGVLELARATPPVPGAASGPLPGAPELALCLRRFAQPRETRVELGATGRPVALYTGPAGRGARRVALRAEGPERISGRWWADGYAREYWLAEAEDGRLWLLFRDGQEGRWHLEGWYD